MQDATNASEEKAKTAKRAMLVAVVSGLLSVALIALYLNRYERETSGGQRIAVLRAIKPIPRGALVTDEMLAESAVPASYLEARAVRAVERSKVIGIRVANGLDTQDTLMWSDLAIAQEERDLSSLIQPGSRAVTIHASSGFDPESAELIRPGDYVDVISTMSAAGGADKTNVSSVLLLQRVLVLAVGTETEPQAFRGNDKDKGKNRPAEMLTLSLKIEEAQLLSLAQQRGQLAVILRPPGDTRIIENAPDMPISSLFDVKFRNDLQRRRSGAPRPVRIAESE